MKSFLFSAWVRTHRRALSIDSPIFIRFLVVVVANVTAAAGDVTIAAVACPACELQIRDATIVCIVYIVDCTVLIIYISSVQFKWHANYIGRMHRKNNKNDGEWQIKLNMRRFQRPITSPIHHTLQAQSVALLRFRHWSLRVLCCLLNRPWKFALQMYIWILIVITSQKTHQPKSKPIFSIQNWIGAYVNGSVCSQSEFSLRCTYVCLTLSIGRYWREYIDERVLVEWAAESLPSIYMSKCTTTTTKYKLAQQTSRHLHFRREIDLADGESCI